MQQPFHRIEQLLLAAFDAGYRASEAGKPIADNPHRPSDPHYDAWNCGWIEYEGPEYTVAGSRA